MEKHLYIIMMSKFQSEERVRDFIITQGLHIQPMGPNYFQCVYGVCESRSLRILLMNVASDAHIVAQINT